MSPTAPRDILLRHTLRVALEQEPLEPLRARVDALASRALSALDAAATAEGLSGLLGALLRRPPFEAAYFANLAQHLASEAELRALASALAPTPILVLKGGSLLQTVYRGRAGARPMADLDLLIEPAGHARAIAWLEARGYRPWLDNPTLLGRLQGPVRVLFDLHTPSALTGADRFERLRRGLRVDVDAVWRRAVPLFADGSSPNLLRMEDGDLLAHATLHALKHGFSRGIWLLDLAALRARVAPETERRRLEAVGGLRALAFADHLLARLLGAPRRHPDLALGLLERWLLDAIEARAPLRGLGSVLMVTSLPTWWDRAAYLVELLALREELAAQEAADTPRWRLIAERGRRAVGLIASLLRRSLSGRTGS